MFSVVAGVMFIIFLGALIMVGVWAIIESDFKEDTKEYQEKIKKMKEEKENN